MDGQSDSKKTKLTDYSYGLKSITLRKVLTPFQVSGHRSVTKKFRYLLEQLRCTKHEGGGGLHPPPHSIVVTHSTNLQVDQGGSNYDGHV